VCKSLVNASDEYVVIPVFGIDFEKLDYGVGLLKKASCSFGKGSFAGREGSSSEAVYAKEEHGWFLCGYEYHTLLYSGFRQKVDSFPTVTMKTTGGDDRNYTQQAH